ncbi:hypothetical protein TNCV_3778561 [Trichonephila clavipes]|nr:hypothetical protein TNCV_3778561 [Trichonephila clavipes]
MDCVQGCLYTVSLSLQTINSHICNGLLSTEPGKQIGTKLFFQMNPASICGEHDGGIRVRRYADEPSPSRVRIRTT